MATVATATATAMAMAMATATDVRTASLSPLLGARGVGCGEGGYCLRGDAPLRRRREVGSR
jgi:hypothetical protein